LAETVTLHLAISMDRHLACRW